MEAVIKHLSQAILPLGGACRIYCSTVCDANGVTLQFPKVDAMSPRGSAGLNAVRDIFRNDHHVRVSQDQSGMLRIAIGERATELLQTKIHSINFNTYQRYNGALAIYAAMNSTEVKAGMRKSRLEPPFTIVTGSVTMPEHGRQFPHLPASIRNVTMDEALDVIAKTFGGIVIYQTCSKENGTGLVSVSFVQVKDI